MSAPLLQKWKAHQKDCQRHTVPFGKCDCDWALHSTQQEALEASDNDARRVHEHWINPSYTAPESKSQARRHLRPISN